MKSCISHNSFWASEYNICIHTQQAVTKDFEGFLDTEWGFALVTDTLQCALNLKQLLIGRHSDKTWCVTEKNLRIRTACEWNIETNERVFSSSERIMACMTTVVKITGDNKCRIKAASLWSAPSSPLSPRSPAQSSSINFLFGSVNETTLKMSANTLFILSVPFFKARLPPPPAGVCRESPSASLTRQHGSRSPSSTAARQHLVEWHPPVLLGWGQPWPLTEPECDLDLRWVSRDFACVQSVVCRGWTLILTSLPPAGL